MHAGEYATFTVQAEGSSFVDDGSEDTGVTYQWWRKKGASSWIAITEATAGTSGYNTASLTVKVYNNMASGFLYMCEVKDGYGNTLRTTEVTHYVVTPVTVTAQPTAALAEDGTATFTFATTGDVKTYQWECLKGTSWVTASGSNYVGYDTTTMSTTVNRSYRCKITDMAGVITYTDVVAFPTAN